VEIPACRDRNEVEIPACRDRNEVEIPACRDRNEVEIPACRDRCGSQRMASMDPLLFKRGLLLFWALYFVLIASSNLCDGLKAAGALPPSWRFASGNYAMVKRATSIYNVWAFINALLFAAVIVWEAVAAALLVRAVVGYTGGDSHSTALVYAGMGAGIGLWAAFILMDEIFFDYEAGLETTHVGLFIAQLLSLIAIVGLPDGAI
jgi:hypothetical protein